MLWVHCGCWWEANAVMKRRPSCIECGHCPVLRCNSRATAENRSPRLTNWDSLSHSRPIRWLLVAPPGQLQSMCNGAALLPKAFITLCTEGDQTWKMSQEGVKSAAPYVLQPGIGERCPTFQPGGIISHISTDVFFIRHELNNYLILGCKLNSDWSQHGLPARL